MKNKKLNESQTKISSIFFDVKTTMESFHTKTCENIWSSKPCQVRFLLNQDGVRGVYVPGVPTGTAGLEAGHSRSRRGTQTSWPGHCWRRWCPTGWARAGRGGTWRFLSAARWRSGDSFLGTKQTRGLVDVAVMISVCRCSKQREDAPLLIVDG